MWFKWDICSVATTAMTILCVINSSYVLLDFNKYPTTTKVRLLHENEAVFPAVTLCNFNPARHVYDLDFLNCKINKVMFVFT